VNALGPSEVPEIPGSTVARPAIDPSASWPCSRAGCSAEAIAGAVVVEAVVAPMELKLDTEAGLI
jgi:hypothetical protein